MTIKAYKYPRRVKKPHLDERVRRLERERDDEGLTGFVANIEARPGEERLARAFRKYNIGFEFQYEMTVLTSIPGGEKVIDFMIGLRRQPVEHYGRIGHESNADKGRDRIREIMINDVMRTTTGELLEVIWYYETEDQEQADAVVKERFT